MSLFLRIFKDSIDTCVDVLCFVYIMLTDYYSLVNITEVNISSLLAEFEVGTMATGFISPEI